MIRCFFLQRNKSTFKNERGSILVSVLAVIFALLTIFLFAMTYTLSRFSIHQRNVNQLVAHNLSEAGINVGLHGLRISGNFDFKDSGVSANHGSYSYSVVPWGPYVLLTSTGIFTNQRVTTRAIVGSDAKSLTAAAMTVGNENFPLYAAGTVRIIGNVITGPLGMAPGQIGGEAAPRNFHNGEVQTKTYVQLPILDTTVLMQYLHDIANRRINTKKRFSSSLVIGKDDKFQFDNNSSVVVENDLVFSEAKLSVYDAVRSIFVDGACEFNQTSRVGGFIELVSNGPVSIEDNAVVDNLLIYCEDSILITDRAVFSGIAISRKRIVVSGQAELSYPATMIVLADCTECDSCGIYLRSTKPLEGVCLIAITDTMANKYDHLLYLDTGAVYTGVLISETTSDLRGTVFGSVITEQFRYEQAPTTYINWVTNLKIDKSKLTFVPAAPLQARTADSGALRILTTVTR